MELNNVVLYVGRVEHLCRDGGKPFGFSPIYLPVDFKAERLAYEHLARRHDSPRIQVTDHALVSLTISLLINPDGLLSSEAAWGNIRATIAPYASVQASLSSRVHALPK